MSLVRTGLVGLVIFAVLGADSPRSPGGSPPPDSASIEVSVDWASADLPKALRKVIHLTTRDLSSFPMADSQLRDPSKWPATMRVGACICSLRFEAFGFDVVRPIGSLDEVRPDDRAYRLHYEYPPQGFRGRYGPAYVWRTKDGAVIERSWIACDATRLISQFETFWPASRVLESSSVNRGRASGWMRFFDHSESQAEFFSQNGALLGCSYGKSVLWWRDGPYYFWAGKPVSRMQLSDETVKLIRYANTKYGIPEVQR